MTEAVTEQHSAVDFISDLSSIGQFIEQQDSIECCLKQLACRVAQILESKRSSIMLIKKSEDGELKLKMFAHYGDLPDVAYERSVNLNEGIAGQVAHSGRPLLVKDISQSAFRKDSQRNLNHIGGGFIATPLTINNDVIGVLNISDPCASGKHYDENDLTTAKLVSLFVSKSIQVFQLQQLLKSNFALRALAMDQQQPFKIESLAADGDRMVKILSKSFFQELKRAGLSRDLIINCATELISQVSNDMRKK